MQQRQQSLLNCNTRRSRALLTVEILRARWQCSGRCGPCNSEVESETDRLAHPWAACSCSFTASRCCSSDEGPFAGGSPVRTTHIPAAGQRRQNGANRRSMQVRNRKQHMHIMASARRAAAAGIAGGNHRPGPISLPAPSISSLNLHPPIFPSGLLSFFTAGVRSWNHCGGGGMPRLAASCRILAFMPSTLFAWASRIASPTSSFRRSTPCSTQNGTRAGRCRRPARKHMHSRDMLGAPAHAGPPLLQQLLLLLPPPPPPLPPKTVCKGHCLLTPHAGTLRAPACPPCRGAPHLVVRLLRDVHAARLLVAAHHHPHRLVGAVALKVRAAGGAGFRQAQRGSRRRAPTKRGSKGRGRRACTSHPRLQLCPCRLQPWRGPSAMLRSGAPAASPGGTAGKHCPWTCRPCAPQPRLTWPAPPAPWPPPPAPSPAPSSGSPSGCPCWQKGCRRPPARDTFGDANMGG